MGTTENGSIRKNPLRAALEIAIGLTIAIFILSVLAHFIMTLFSSQPNDPTATSAIMPSETFTVTPSETSTIVLSETFTVTPSETSTIVPSLTPMLESTIISTIIPTEKIPLPTPPSEFRVGPWHDDSTICDEKNKWVRIKGVEIFGGIPPYKITFRQFDRSISIISHADGNFEFPQPVIVNKGSRVKVTISYKTINGDVEWVDALYYHLKDPRCLNP